MFVFKNKVDADSCYVEVHDANDKGFDAYVSAKVVKVTDEGLETSMATLTKNQVLK